MNVDKQALRGLSVESPFYLAECCNCGEIMPSSKLRESRNYPDDDGECHCPHCNADDCDIADSGAVGSEGVTAWNYQQKRIEALLDELDKPKFVQCWSCKHDIEILAIADCDGYCPRCAAPIDIDDEPYSAAGKGE